MLLSRKPNFFLVCVFSAAACSPSIAQGTVPPPPAVSVVSVISRQITETGSFVGHVTAITRWT